MPTENEQRDDEQEVRGLIERWAAAVRRGDLDGVLAHHRDDIVMFDVPPPFEGVRGLDAYRATWPPFFDWLSAGAAFEIESLDVTAGADVAFAHALLRCGTERDFAERPALRLRLTLGLQRTDGQWQVTHEHHSFPDTSVAPEATPEPAPDAAATPDAVPEAAAAGDSEPSGAAEREVRAIHDRWAKETAAKDLDGLMAHVAEDVVSYEHAGPLGYRGVEEVREICRNGLAVSPGPVVWDIPDLTVRVGGDLAVTWGLEHIRSTGADGTTAETWSRGTRVFERRDGGWAMVHQHLSFPLPS